MSPTTISGRPRSSRGWRNGRAAFRRCEAEGRDASFRRANRRVTSASAALKRDVPRSPCAQRAALVPSAGIALLINRRSFLPVLRACAREDSCAEENTMQLIRRQFLRLTCTAAATSVVSSTAGAPTYPTRSGRTIAPSPAGGPAPVLAPALAQPLTEPWGQPFYGETLPPGASNVGPATAAKAPADGYTLLIVTPSFVINPSLYAKLAYDPIRDFTAVALAVTSPHVLVVNPSFPAHNVKELVALVKANPGKYSYASAGTGQSAQLACELFKLGFGLVLLHVPFNGGAPAMNSTIGGHTPIAFNALPSAAALIKEGKLRALAVTSGQRAPEFPDVPTLAEAGVLGQESLFF